ncbi:MAG: hypothetical protein H7Z42_03625, partial [Roseiflexaceae bacterium]|nr:hypothetical protein [Roseiflexaceae bacterium]
MLALFAIAVLAPLLYIPGLLIERALNAAPLGDRLELHYARTVIGALLHGWLTLTLAEFGVFSAWLHVLITALVCAASGLIAQRRGRLRRSESMATPRWQLVAAGALGLLVLVLAAQPFEVIIGGRTPHRLVFSGDIGRWNQPIIRDPRAPKGPVDTLIIESTYS